MLAPANAARRMGARHRVRKIDGPSVQKRWSRRHAASVHDMLMHMVSLRLAHLGEITGGAAVVGARGVNGMRGA